MHMCLHTQEHSDICQTQLREGHSSRKKDAHANRDEVRSAERSTSMRRRRRGTVVNAKRRGKNDNEQLGVEIDV